MSKDGKEKGEKKSEKEKPQTTIPTAPSAPVVEGQKVDAKGEVKVKKERKPKRDRVTLMKEGLTRRIPLIRASIHKIGKFSGGHYRCAEQKEMMEKALGYIEADIAQIKAQLAAQPKEEKPKEDPFKVEL
jgi:hypothetical protein